MTHQEGSMNIRAICVGHFALPLPIAEAVTLFEPATSGVTGRRSTCAGSRGASAGRQSRRLEDRIEESPLRAYAEFMTARERLHQIVDELPEPDAEQILRAVEQWRDDPVSRALAAAPVDDEPETDDERAAVEEARDEVRRGDVVTAAEVWDER
jgi:hypothetical protein